MRLISEKAMTCTDNQYMKYEMTSSKSVVRKLKGRTRQIRNIRRNIRPVAVEVAARRSVTGGRSSKNKVKRLGTTSNVDIISGRRRSALRVYKFVKPGAGPLNAEWH